MDPWSKSSCSFRHLSHYTFLEKEMVAGRDEAKLERVMGQMVTATATGETTELEPDRLDNMRSSTNLAQVLADLLGHNPPSMDCKMPLCPLECWWDNEAGLDRQGNSCPTAVCCSCLQPAGRRGTAIAGFGL
mmetsp:Transcript_38975/g.75613  ORF Transcript_38975/g.75613 Transcript_38975/m.75613 type:complete len:132 (+) Transcript_38975:277-672(+)